MVATAWLTPRWFTTGTFTVVDVALPDCTFGLVAEYVIVTAPLLSQLLMPVTFTVAFTVSALQSSPELTMKRPSPCGTKMFVSIHL